MTIPQTMPSASPLVRGGHHRVRPLRAGDAVFPGASLLVLMLLHPPPPRRRLVYPRVRTRTTASAVLRGGASTTCGGSRAYARHPRVRVGPDLVIEGRPAGGAGLGRGACGRRTGCGDAALAGAPSERRLRAHLRSMGSEAYGGAALRRCGEAGDVERGDSRTSPRRPGAFDLWSPGWRSTTSMTGICLARATPASRSASEARSGVHPSARRRPRASTESCAGWLGETTSPAAAGVDWLGAAVVGTTARSRLRRRAAGPGSP